MSALSSSSTRGRGGVGADEHGVDRACRAARCSRRAPGGSPSPLRARARTRRRARWRRRVAPCGHARRGEELPARPSRQPLPERLGDERHHRMQQAQRAVEHVHEHGARRVAVGAAGGDAAPSSSPRTSRRARSRRSAARSRCTRSTGVRRAPRSRSICPRGGRAAPSAASHSRDRGVEAREDPLVGARELRGGDRARAARHASSPTLVSRKRPMFQSLVAKFRPGAKDCSRFVGSSITSVPSPSPAITV